MKSIRIPVTMTTSGAASYQWVKKKMVETYEEVIDGKTVTRKRPILDDDGNQLFTRKFVCKPTEVSQTRQIPYDILFPNGPRKTPDKHINEVLIDMFWDWSEVHIGRGKGDRRKPAPLKFESAYWTRNL